MRRMTERQVVIVTGSGGTGCGRAIAKGFARGGAAVVVTDVNDAGGRETVASIESSGGAAAFFRADVGDAEQARRLVEYAENTYGRLDVLINNASSPHPSEDGIAGWSGALYTDLLGSIHCTRWAVEAMRRSGGGAIVNISSISALWHGRTSPGGFNGYDVAKLGVLRMTTVLAKDLAAQNIRINCLAPGWIATDGPRQYWESLTPPEREERGVPAVLLPTDDIVRMVQRLAGDTSLNGRIVVWWSTKSPRLIEWGDRGYCDFVEMDFPDK